VGRAKRFFAAAAVSLAVHGLIGVGAYKIFTHKENPRPQAAQQVLHEEIHKQEKKPDLNTLKEERSQYLSGLLSSLHEGREIQLSEFLIRSETLDRNITLAERGEFGTSEQKSQEKYSEILERARARTLGNENKAKAIHEFLHTEVFSGYFYGNGEMLDVLNSGVYNCLSSTLMSASLITDLLGRGAQNLLILDDHVASFIDGKVLENTAHEWDSAVHRYNGCGMVAPSEILVAAYLVKHGTPVEGLPGELVSFYKTRKKWPGCPTTGKSKVPGGMGAPSGLPNPGVLSGMEVPSYFDPNPNYKSGDKEIVKTAKALLSAYKLANLHDYREYIPVKVDGKEVYINPILLPPYVDWALLLEVFKSEFNYREYLTLWPERFRCHNWIQSISPKTIVEIIEGLPGAEKSKFPEHTEERICDRFMRSTKHGSYEEFKHHSSFTFCKEMSEALKERYEIERKRLLDWEYTVPLSALGYLRLEENFDFCRKELFSASEFVIRAHAAHCMLLADKQKACRVLEALPKKQKAELHWIFDQGCRVSKYSWEMQFRQGRPDSVALHYLEGERLSREQIDFLKKHLSSRIGFLDYPQSATSMVRILYEAGEKELARKRLEELVELASKDSKGELSNLFSSSFPPELTPTIRPLLSDPRYVVPLTNWMYCYGTDSDYPQEGVDALRKVVSDQSRGYYDRVKAAAALIRMGHDPLPLKP
jgi:hypothetical protein